MGSPSDLPLVSIIVPAYNAASTLARTLYSALAQTYRNVEVIVVDDGSSDATADIVRTVQEQDDRVVLVTQANAGVAAARNAAVERARGDYVAPLDADDLWHPTKIERQLSRLARQPDAVMVYCWSADIDGNEIVRERRLDVVRFEGDVLAPLLVANFIDTSSVPLIRKDAVAAAGGWDESLRACDAQGCEDWMLYVKLAAMGDILLEPAFLVGYRQSPDAMSRNFQRMRRSMELVHRAAKHSFPSLPHWVFRQSRAQFDHYMADLLREDGRLAASLRQRGLALLRDPAWLASRTARRRLKGWLRRRPAYPPAGGGSLPYADLDPEPAYFPPPDGWTRRRNRRLSSANLAATREI